jgi:hypothetical protein
MRTLRTLRASSKRATEKRATENRHREVDMKT